MLHPLENVVKLITVTIDGCCYSNVVNFSAAGPKLTKLQHNIPESLPLNFLKSELRSYNPFWNVSVTNEGGATKIAHLVKKSVASNILERSQNE